MVRNGRRFLAVIILLPLIQLVRPAGATDGRVIGGVELGFDSFTEKYSVVEEDTLDQLTEFRSRMHIGYIRGKLLEDYLQIGARTLIGEESFESSGRLDLMHRFDRSRLAVNGEVTHRTFRDNSVYTFANDFLRYNMRAYYLQSLTSDLALRLTERIEVMDFDQRTQFDYDYVRNSITLRAEYDRNFTTSVQTSLGYTHKAIPDSTEISYDAISSAVEFQRSFDLHKQLFVSFSSERRIYEDAATKSHYWALFSNIDIEPVTWGNFGLSLDNDLESYFYDADTDVFFDYVENRSALLFNYFRSLYFTVGAGPTFGLFVSELSEEDEYTEYGAKLSLSYSHSDKIWLSASYEPGSRNYRLDSGGSDVIFSDFIYHRFLVFTTVRVWHNTNVNLFLNHEPEDHKIEDDDSTATLFSLDIAYRF